MAFRTNGSKPCPHCGRPISANKELCYAAVVAYGTLENFEESERKLAAAMENAAAEIEAEEERHSGVAAAKPKRARKTKVAAIGGALVDLSESAPKPARKPRAKKSEVMMAPAVI